MLEGEKKRRDIAIKWLGKVQEVLLPVAEDIWGNEDPSEVMWTAAVYVKGKNSEGKYYSTNIYFRWSEHEGKYKDEKTGFYLSTSPDMWWGKRLEDVRGPNFWWAIEKIVEWIEWLEKKRIPEKEKIREDILSLIIK